MQQFNDTLIVGLGSAGGNIVNNLICSSLEKADFLMINTDANELENSLTENRIQLIIDTSSDKGAFVNPRIGIDAVTGCFEEIRQKLSPYNRVLLIAGMGGNTGTGSISLLASEIKSKGKNVICIVLTPFQFEGKDRIRQAEQGIADIITHGVMTYVYCNSDVYKISRVSTFGEACRDIELAFLELVNEVIKNNGLIESPPIPFQIAKAQENRHLK